MKPKRFGTPIFVFDDYVDYLKVWYSYARRFGFTQKMFMEKARINAKAFFSDVLAQRKKIGEKHIQGFIDALELSPDEAEYFTLLVHKKNEHTPDDINIIGKKLSTLRAKKAPVILSGGGTAEYFSSWKYPVIREYVKTRGIVRSPDEICKSLLHLKISLTESRQALLKLQKWNMIEYDEHDQGYRSVNECTVSYSEMPHAVVNDVKRTFIEASIQSMENHDKNMRNISLSVKGMNKESYAKFCRKIDEVRKEFLDAGDDNEQCDYIYTLLVQLYPVMQIDQNSDNEVSQQ